MAAVDPPAFPLTRFGKYRLVAKLAEGGMAEIHLAVEDMDRAGRRFVIIKRIRDAFAHDPDYSEFFVTEGRLALKVTHPNLPQAYELGEVDGVAYLSMEFIRGPTVLDMLRKAHQRNTPVSVRTTLTVARSVAAALEHAHGLRDVDGEHLRVIHRDVTPQNVLVGYDGTVKLIDFGIAQARVQSHETAAGVVKGKFSYLAPEQIQRNATVDHRADLFALGILMHECLCGRVLFRGRTDRETIQRVLRAPVPNPSAIRAEIPPELSHVVLRALARDPTHRYPSATALLTELEAVADRAGLGASVVMLRDEVRALCGQPRDYRIPAIQSVDIDFDETGAITAVLPPSATPPLALGGDRELRYFLSHAGIVPRKRRARRLQTTRSDLELAELLASLER